MLSDLLIVDLSTYLPGPYATSVLAGFGARVIKVEAPSGDPIRHVPPHDAAGLSAAYRALNRGKESLALDLKQEAGRELLLRLVERADALLEGFRPGVMERLGVGPTECLAANPRLVYCRLSGYGQDGPYRDRAGHDLNYQAYSGSLGLGTSLEGHPTTPGVQSGDLLGGYAAALGILAALRGRTPLGGGRVVDVSILDALISAQGIHFAAHASGTQARPRGMPLNGGFPCYDVYETSCGGHFALAALEPKFWHTYCEIVARPEWEARGFDPSLRDEVAELFATRSREEWRIVLENSACCAAPVLSYDEVSEDDQVVARRLCEEGRVASPVRFDPPATPRAYAVASTPGADRSAVLSDLLGLDDDAQARLAEKGAFGAGS
ncbi:MAG: CoA transferase [Planctomycetes bacterium]|nr:CoA transferase [Planctomycetota bacterium]